MTQPSTDRSVRKLRHSIRKRAYMIFHLTAGQPGAPKEMQIAVFDKQIELLTQALEKAKEAREIVVNRDFDAYKAAKDTEAAKAAATHDQIADGEEKAVADLTFEQIIAKLNGEIAEATEDAKPEDQNPPF